MKYPSASSGQAAHEIAERYAEQQDEQQARKRECRVPKIEPHVARQMRSRNSIAMPRNIKSHSTTMNGR
jgi:hypothetical protein